MLVAQKRLQLASLGGALAGGVVAIFEARAAVAAGATDSAIALFVADFGVLLPPCALLGLGVGFVHWTLEPGLPQPPDRYLSSLRQAPVLARSRLAAVVPLATLATFCDVVAIANLARGRLAVGTPAEAGALLAIEGMGVVALSAAAVFAFTPALRRALAAGFDRRPWLLDPMRTGAVAAALVAAAFVFGVRAGDVGGDGAFPLGVFGVLRRDELDLRPVASALFVVALAYILQVWLSGRKTSRLVAAAGLALAAALSVATTVRASALLNASPSLTRALERSAPLGRQALALLRRATDRDRDGASALFGGGDCDDRDFSRSPSARDVPGNGVDEDCSGADSPLPAPAPSAPAPAALAVTVPSGLNVVLITIDTLRPDVGFMGYGKATTPNLDALASKAVVFERAYAMASYTGKSVGPLLIGQYPSETQRDGGHFNRYSAANLFVAERLKADGVRTFGAASHWYFGAWSGLSQGIDEWDLSAKPKDGQGDNDTSVTSAELSSAALRLLAKPANTSGRFFMWLHYFDPHEQYVEHRDAPDFAGPGARIQAVIRGRYDGEVWFTDKHIGRVLDFIAAQPWGERTAIVVTSDHGEAFGEHDMSWHGAELWEPLVRVPLLVYLPGAKPHRVAEKRSHVDLVPTLLDLMRVAPQGGELSGRSLLADLVGQAPFEERDVFLDMPGGPYTQMRKAIITGPSPGKKLIYSGGKNYQLYDLATDPDEARDLSADPAQMAPALGAFDRARGNLREFDVKPDAP